MRSLRKFNADGDCGGMQRSCSKVSMQNINSVVLRDRQRPDQIIEVTRVALTNRLKIFDAIEHNSRV